MLRPYMRLMHLRKAALDDVEQLQYWDSKPHVVASTGDDDWFDWPVELARDPLITNKRAQKFCRRLRFAEDGTRVFEQDECLAMASAEIIGSS